MENKNNKSSQRTIVLTLFIAFNFIVLTLAAQSTDIAGYLSMKKLPDGLVLREQGAQRYTMISDYYNHDILGNFLNKMRVQGTYTRGNEGGNVKWNHVTIAQSNSVNGVFPLGEDQLYMENFSYKPSEKMMENDPYKDFPMATGVFGKNLVWDVMGLEAFAWVYYDSLELNSTFSAKNINGAVNIENLGVFENKDIKLTWTGISMIHDEPCAVIEYLALNNPLEFNTDFMNMKGRSHYWGTLWLSLSDKEIEKAVLYEDVNMDMKMAGQEKSQLFNTTREIIFSKITDGI